MFSQLVKDDACCPENESASTILINKLVFRLGGRQFGTLGEFQSITHTKKTGNYREIVMDKCVCVHLWGF